MPIIQVTTIGGKIIEKAKWEVETLANMREGHQLLISMDVSERNLVQFLGKHGGMDCVLEKKDKTILNGDDEGYYVVVTLQVMKFKHMFDHEKLTLSSMAFAVPINRTVENVVTYLMDQSKCDPRFTQAIQKP